MSNTTNKKDYTSEEFGLPQWFIITAIGGKENSIAETLKEKIKNFGFENYVKEIKVFHEEIITEQVFKINDPELPKSFKNTKTTKWEVLPDGSYKKIKVKVINKFPGYIFVNMIMSNQVWYTVRNTAGVLGFVGSSGKGALPIPISNEEYDTVWNKKPTESVEENVKKVDEPKKVFTTNLKVGNPVEITDGAFAGEFGEIKNIDLEKGVAMVEIEMFGRVTTVQVPFDGLKIAD